MGSWDGMRNAGVTYPAAVTSRRLRPHGDRTATEVLTAQRRCALFKTSDSLLVIVEFGFNPEQTRLDFRQLRLYRCLHTQHLRCQWPSDDGPEAAQKSGVGGNDGCDCLPDLRIVQGRVSCRLVTGFSHYIAPEVLSATN